MGEGVDDGVGDGWRRPDGGRLADALGTERMVRRWRDGLGGLPARGLHRRRHQVVHETAALHVAVLVVADLLEQRRREAHGEAAVDLPVDDHRVDDVPAVVDGDEATDLHHARATIDVHHADVAAERERQVGRVVVRDRLEPRLHPRRVVGVGRERDLGDRLRSRRRALHRELARLPFQVVLGDLEQVRRDLPRLVPDLARGDGPGGAGGRGRAAGVRSQPVRRGVRVALLDLHVRGRDAKLLRDDLRGGGLVALTLRLGAEAGDRLAGGVHADLRRIEHLDAEDVELLRRPGTDDLGEARNADAHQFAPGALLRLLLAQAGVVDQLNRLPERRRVVAAVVLPAERRAVRELLLWDEVLHAQVDRIHLQLLRQAVGDALDGVDRLGDAEGAAIGDAAP